MAWAALLTWSVHDDAISFAAFSKGGGMAFVVVRTEEYFMRSRTLFYRQRLHYLWTSGIPGKWKTLGQCFKVRVDSCVATMLRASLDDGRSWRPKPGLATANLTLTMAKRTTRGHLTSYTGCTKDVGKDTQTNMLVSLSVETVSYALPCWNDPGWRPRFSFDEY